MIAHIEDARAPPPTLQAPEMNSSAVSTRTLGASSRVSPIQRALRARGRINIVNSNSRRFEGHYGVPPFASARDDAIGVRLRREGKLRDKSIANHEAAVAAAIATGIAVAIVAAEPAHGAALASHLMPPTVYAPQFQVAADLVADGVNPAIAADVTLDTTLISTSAFLLLATVLGAAGKKDYDRRAKRDPTLWSDSESVTHRRSNIVAKRGSTITSSTKIDAPGAKSLKSSRYNITPLRKGDVDNKQKDNKPSGTRKLPFNKTQKAKGKSNIVAFRKTALQKNARKPLDKKAATGTVFVTKKLKKPAYGTKKSAGKSVNYDSALAAAAAFVVGAVALTNVAGTAPAPSARDQPMKIGAYDVPAPLRGGIRELGSMRVPPEIGRGAAAVGANVAESFETAAESFDALPPEQSAATLGAVGVVALLALTSVVAAKRDADYFEPKVYTFGDSIIADRTAAAARAEEAQAWIDAWYRTDAGAKTFKRVKHRSLAYEDPTMVIDALTITTGTGKKPVPRRPSAFRSDRDALLHDAYHKSIEIVDGVKLDKKILNVVRDFEANLTVIDIRQARRILKLVTDGPVRDHKRASGKTVQSTVGNIELDTALYALDSFKWTSQAKTWFFKELEQYF